MIKKSSLLNAKQSLATDTLQMIRTLSRYSLVISLSHSDVMFRLKRLAQDDLLFFIHGIQRTEEGAEEEEEEVGIETEMEEGGETGGSTDIMRGRDTGTGGTGETETEVTETDKDIDL